MKFTTRFILIVMCICLIAGCAKPAETRTLDAENIEMQFDPLAENDIITGFATPESVGISSSNIQKVFEQLAESKLPVNSVLIISDGKIIAESYATPFDTTSFHRMYSISKSFTSMAIGLLIQDGYITLSSTLEELFPEYITNTTDDRIAKTEIVDLLTMSSPYEKTTYDGRTDTNWIETFFTAEADKEPGTEFYYDTSATYVLDVLVEKLTGMDFMEYLQERALDKIGFSETAYCIDAPEGYAWGGSGVLCTTRDLARFALLVMQGGVFEGEELLPSEYIKEATRKQIQDITDLEVSYKGHGYGYQIWMTEYGYSFIGMGDQLAICVPEKNLLFVCTADNQGNSEARQIIYDAFEKYILNEKKNFPLEDNPESLKELYDVLNNMELPSQEGKASSNIISRWDEKVLNAVDLSKDIKSFSIDWEDTEGTLYYTTSEGEQSFSFGLGKNVIDILEEPTYSGDTIGQPNGSGYRIASSGAWIDNRTFVLWVQVIDNYLGNMKMTFTFENEGVYLAVTKNAEWFLDEYEMSERLYKVGGEHE